ncbi:MAG: shikimate kinase, partial [Streptosporangiaceae bacterium]
EHDGVLALGGGAVLDEGARTLLRDQHVVFLDVGLADAARRVGLARSRPLLVGNPRTTLRRQLEARHPFYEDVASTTVATDGRDPAEVTDDVLATLKEGGEPG